MRFLRRAGLALIVILGACVTDLSVGPRLASSLSVSPSTPSLSVGEDRQMLAIARDSRGVPFVGLPTTWTTDNASVATITALGMVHGVSVGTATITATSGGQTATTLVTVAPAPVIAVSATSRSFAGTPGAPDPGVQTIGITNVGGGSLDDLALGTISYGAGASGWLNASLDQAAVPATLTLAVATGTRPLGSYSATVPITSTKANNSPRTITVNFAVVAGAATTISVNAGDGQSGVVNAALGVAPSVIVHDAFNNPVPGVAVTFAVTGGGGSITGPNPATTNASGIAQVGWVMGTAAGSNTLSATSGSLTGSPVNFSANAAAAAPAQIAAIAGNGQTATVNTAVPVSPAVRVTDAFGNPVSGVGVVFAVASGGGTITSGAPTTDGSGVAQVLLWTLGQTAGGNTLTATSGTLTGSPVTFTATGTAGPATQLVKSAGDNQSATVNTAVATGPRVLVMDAFNNPIAGVAVTFTVTGGGGAISGANPATTDGSGLAQVGWTLGTAAGANTLGASAAGLSAVTFTATGTPGPATLIVKTAGDLQTAEVVTPLATPPRVQTLDQFGNGVAGVSVTFAVTGGGGSLSGTNPATTDASGFAQIGWIMGIASGANSLTATATGLTGSPLTFTATATSGGATQVVISAGDGQFATVNSAVATPPRVLVTDALGNPVPGFAVTFAVTSGGGNISGANQTTNSSGLAQVGGWVLGTTAGPNTLTATAPGLAGSPITFTATGTAGSATQIAVGAGNAQTATVNTAVATAPQVVVRDAFNNAVPGVSVTFAVAGGGGSFTGPNPVTTNALGRAQISWTLGTVAGANTMTASATGLAGSPVGFTATSTPGPATQIAKSAGDAQSATAGTAVAVPPRVVVRDQFGNGVQGVAVTFAVASGGGSLTGSNPATTDASGFAQIGWTLGAAAGANSLTATATGLTGSPQTFTATGMAGGATQIALNAGDAQTGTVNTAVGTAPRVLVRDALNNPVSGVSVTFAVTGGGGSLTGPNPATTDAAGFASIGWTLGTTAGTNNNTMTATATGLAGSPVTFTATATAAAATQIAVSAGNGQSATVNTTVATPPRVVVRDAFNNAVPGVSVTFAVTGGGGTLTGTNPTTTDASGFAAIGWTLGTTAGTSNNTLTATSAGLTGSPVTFTASATAGAATQIAVSAGDGQTATVNTAVAIAPRIVVRDAFNNPVSGVGVTFAVTGGGGSLTGINPTTTDASGFASIGWTLGTVAGSNNNTLTATSTGLTGSPVTFTASATAAAAAQIAVSAGDGQSAAVGTAVAVAPRVLVRDAFNNAVSGVSVSFAVTVGAGSLTGTNPATTDASGFAQIGWTLGPSAGANTLTATSAGLSGSPVTFNATATAGAATQIALNAGAGQTATVNTAVATAPRVLVRDALNNPVSGVSVTFAVTGGGGSLSGPNPATTDVNGFASIGWTLGTTAGTNNNTLTATSAGLSGSPVTFTASATAGAATQIALNQGDNQTATVNTAVAIAPRILVRDAFNNAVSGVSVAFAVTAGGGSLTGTNPANTDASGFASIGWTLGTVAGTNTLTATATGLTGSPVTFTATGTAGAATQLAKIAGDNQSAEVNAAVPVAPRVQVQDQFGNGVAGQDVAFAVTGGGGTTTGPNPASTDAQGFAQIGWTLGAIAGSNTLLATAIDIGTAPSVSFTANSFAAGATTLLLTAGNNQTDTVGATLAVQYQVRVTDGVNGVQGIPVSWAVTGGGGSINPPTSFSDINGFATATRTLSTSVGTHTATASAGGLTGSPATFTATATHGVATQIAVNGGSNQSATVNTAVAVAPSVVVRDQFGNVVPGINVTFAVTAGGGSVNPVTPIATDINGVAQVTSWTLGTVAGTGNNTLSATAAGLSGSPVGFTASGTAGAATQIAVSAGNGQTATVNTAVATPPRVVVRDAFNNAVAGVSVTFTVTGGGGSLTGTNPATTDASGFASIGWTLGSVAGSGNNTLTATATGITGSPVAFSASATASAATQIVLNQGNNQTATVNQAVSIAPRVLVRDAFNNAVPGVSVTFAVTGGGGTLTGTNPATTDGNGFAQIGWTLGTAAGTSNNTLTATATGLTGSPVTFTASATAGTATQITLNQGDNQTATVNTTVGVAPRVLVQDAFNNAVSGVSVTFAVTGGAGSLTGTNPTTTDGNGFAQIGWTLGTTAGSGNNTLTATSAGLTGSPVTFTASAAAGAATQIALSAGDAQTAIVTTAVATPPRVVVRDAFNNAVSGVSVSFAVTGGGGSLTGTNPTTTDVNGFAQIGWTLGTVAGSGNNTLSASSGSLTGSPVTFTASATAGAPSASQSSVAASSPIIASSGASLSTVTVTVRDQFNNPVSGATVTLAVSGSGNSINQPVAATNASGVTSGTFSSTVAQSKTVSAVANPGAVAITQNAVVVVNPATVSAAQSSVSASPTSITASSGGMTSTITVTARDQFGNVVPGATVVLAASGSGNTVTQPAALTDVNGQTTGTLSSTAAQLKTVSATANTIGITQTAGVTVTNAAAASIALNAGDNQAAVVNSGVATPPSVVVRDQFSNPVPSHAVTFAVTGGGGALVGTNPTTTDINGVAQIGWTLGTTAGSNNNTLTAASSGLAGSPVTFTASATVGAPSASQSSVTASSPITASAGASQSVITVTVRDAFNNVIAGANVSWVSSGTGNTLTSSSGTTDGAGVFNLGRLSSTVAQTKTITATVNGAVVITQQPTVVVDPAGVSAAQSSVVAAPPTIGASAGGTTSTITVTVRDQFNNAISGATVVLGATGSGNTVTQPASLTNGSGVATGTISSTVAQAKTVSAQANTVSITQTAVVTVVGGTPTQIFANSSQNQSATVNTAVGVPPSVIVRDAFNNVVQGASVTFTVTSGGGSTSPVSGSSILTGVNGVATLTSWTLGATAGTNNNTVSASATGLAGSPVTFTASALAGGPSASQSSVSGLSPITASNGASTSTITVVVRDAFNNPISGASVTLSATGTGNTITQPASTTNGSGVATGTISSTVAQSKTVSALVNGAVTIIQTATVVVNPAAVNAGTSSVTRATATITACLSSCVAGSTASTITVTARDAFTNLVPSVGVTIASSGANNTFSPASGTTNGSGIFTTNFNSTLAQAKTITATISGVVITQTASVTVVAAGASTIGVSGGTGQTARVNTSLPVNPSFVVFDQFSNAVSGATVTYSVTLGGGFTSSGSSLTNASGIASIGWTVGGSSTEGATGLMPQTLQASTAGAGSTSITANARYHWSDVAVFMGGTRCSNCHGTAFTTPPNFVGQPATFAPCGTAPAQTRVVAGNELSGILYRKVANLLPYCGGFMPPSPNPAFNSTELKILRAWIRNGALNN